MTQSNTIDRQSKIRMTQKMWMWFFYFVVMFCFYTYTYVQLLAQFIVIFDTVYTLIISRKGKFQKFELIKQNSYVLWYGLFTLWCFLSLKWCIYLPRTDANTLLGIFRIFAIGFCLTFYVLNNRTLNHLIYTFLHSGAVFAVVTFLINPINTWGSIDFVSFGNGYIRNGIANFALFLICFCVFYQWMLPKWKRNLFIILFLGLILACGSRRAIIQLVFIIILYVLTMKNLKKKVQWVMISGLFAILLVIIANSIPYLRETYISRIADVFLGTESQDGSTIGRTAYIMIGWDMFLQSPLKGWGVDAFYNYLFHNPYAFASNYRLEAVYSHNNYIEILSCFGFIGAILFYQFHIRTFIRNIKNVKYNNVSRMVVIIICTFLLGDYGGITFSNHITMYILFITFCAEYLEYSNRCTIQTNIMR